MPIKIKAKEGLKAIVRCSNPMELQWWMQIQANMRNPEGKINPLVSVQGLDGKEIPAMSARPQSKMVASGEMIQQGNGAVKIIPEGETKDEKKTLPVEIVSQPKLIVEEKKDVKPSVIVDEGKTG